MLNFNHNKPKLYPKNHLIPLTYSNFKKKTELKSTLQKTHYFIRTLMFILTITLGFQPSLLIKKTT